MVLAGELLTDIQGFINAHGTICRIRKFTKTIGAGSFDSDVLLTSGVDTWQTGCIQAVGFNENQLVAEGMLKRDDLKVYFDSSVNVSGLWRLGLGSPPTEEYSVANRGFIDSPQIAGSILYQKVFVRKLQNGSLFGE